MKKTNDQINDDLQPAIIYIPKDAVSMTVTCKLMDPDNYEIYECVQKLDLSMIKDAIIDGDEWEADNVKYSINPDYLKEIKENGKSNS